MTKKEIDELKKEIKNEVLQEIKKEMKGGKFNFSAYKQEVVSDDIIKAQEFLDKNRWYWYIPVIGFCIYMYELTQMLTSIDRGILRKKINRASLPWLWIDIPFYYGTFLVCAINYFPLRTKAILRKAIQMAMNEKDD
ncbi:MAG: hypothetical protein GY679_03430 [Mycoplasma sp.]|nr:hypothetical protein [Mycoplasma sp.]